MAVPNDAVGLNKNMNEQNIFSMDKTTKNLFNAALNIHENLRQMKKIKKGNNLTDEDKQLLERSDSDKTIIAKYLQKIGKLFTQKNMIEVLKHIAALAFILVVLYIMYLVLDMAFGPKTYKSKRRM